MAITLDYCIYIYIYIYIYKEPESTLKFTELNTYSYFIQQIAIELLLSTV